MEAGREDVSLVNWSVCRVEGIGETLMAGKPAGGNNNNNNQLLNIP